MIEYVPLSGLGFSLKPPSWLRKAASDLIKGTKVSVPPVTVPTPGGGSVTVVPPGAGQRGAGEQINAAVTEKVPGGWLTVALLAGVAVFVLPKMMRGRRG